MVGDFSCIKWYILSFMCPLVNFPVIYTTYRWPQLAKVKNILHLTPQFKVKTQLEVYLWYGSIHLIFICYCTAPQRMEKVPFFQNLIIGQDTFFGSSYFFLSFYALVLYHVLYNYAVWDFHFKFGYFYLLIPVYVYQ